MDVVHKPEMTSPPNPLVSVCIANFNGQEVIAECIDSVLAQIGAPPIEIIVHDDASGDESLRILAGYPNVRTLSSDRNVGFCESNNHMAAVARGKYLLLLNNDAVLANDAVASLYEAARVDEHRAILSVPQFDYRSSVLLDRGLKIDLFANPIPVLDQAPQSLAMVMGSCLWIAHEVWTRAGGFPSWMGSIGEDLYLCCAARFMGYPVKVTEKSGYRHRVGNSFGGGRIQGNRLHSTFRRRALSEKNKTCVMLVFYPWWLLIAVLPLHFIALAIEAVVLATANRNWAVITNIYLNALRGTWADRRHLLKSRRTMHALRSIQWRIFFQPFSMLPWKLTLLFRHGFPSVG